MGWENKLFSSFMRQYLKNVYKIRPNLVLMTNMKLHARFQLASRSMTLDDLEQLQSSNFLGISRDFADLGGNNG